MNQQVLVVDPHEKHNVNEKTHAKGIKSVFESDNSISSA